MALGPAEPEADLERPLLGLGVRGARVAGDVQAGDADAPPARVIGHGSALSTVAGASWAPGPCARRLEADGVNRAVDLGLADDLGDLLVQLRVLGDVYGLAAEGARLRQPLLVAGRRR